MAFWVPRNQEKDPVLNERKSIINSNEILDKKVKVNGGKQEYLTIKSNESYSYFGIKGQKVSLDIEYKLPENIKAPIKEGDKIGNISIYKDGILIKEVDLVSAETINKQSFTDLIKKVIKSWKI